MLQVAGTMSLATGVWLRADSRFRDFLSQRYRNVVQEAFWQVFHPILRCTGISAPTLYIFSYLLIVLGMSLAVLGVVGCCAASIGSRALLVIYAIAAFLVMLCIISSSLYLIFKKYGIDVEVADALNYMVQNYYQGASIVQESLDRLQHTFRCCGNAGCDDFRFLHQDPPRSCDIRCDGCHYRIMTALQIAFSAALVIFLVVVIAQLTAVVSASIMVVSTKRAEEQWLEKRGCSRRCLGKNYWLPAEPDRFIDLNSLRSDDCPLSRCEHFGHFSARQRF
ncbi:unnamed protein product [Gongylonema pulchrum]|uniref:Tetraspanin n=1 Tax=Gongylonema pulchrum TaxID=637853 RepID=A0A183E7B7_9BILA|nr:unnamed protein product [Gongylonema pulchrum]